MTDRRARARCSSTRRRAGRPPMRLEALEERTLLSASAIVPADFDGDGRSDLAIYSVDESRGVGRFEVERSSFGRFEVDFGGPGDRPVSGDFNGNGRSDYAVYGFSPDDGFSRFAVLPSNGSPAFLQGFGGFDDLPVSGDFDGDGQTDFAVFGFSPDNGFARFAVLLSGGPTEQHPQGVIMFPFGGPDDVPIAGDFDGDGITDFGVYGPSSTTPGANRFAIVLSGGPTAEHPDGVILKDFGGVLDVPAVGDFDGDGRSDLAVAGFSPLEGFRRFAIVPSNGSPARSVPFGGFDDLPVPIDTVGDGITDIAVYGFSPVEGFSRFAVLPSDGAPAFSLPMGDERSISVPAPALMPVLDLPTAPSPPPVPDRPTFQIEWVNRGTTTDQFSDAERLVIDHAIGIWEDLIIDNYRPDNTMRITFLGGAGSGLDMGDTLGLATVRYDAIGPFDATIEMSANGGGRGWYVDPTPHDDLEFSIAATPTFLIGGPSDQYDFLSTVVHEIGHALGLGIGFDERVPERLTPLPDGRVLYEGPTGVTAVLNDHMDHLDDLYHAYDLMAAEALVGTRAYPTALNLLLLADIYNYRVALPAFPPDTRGPQVLDARIMLGGFGSPTIAVTFDEAIDLVGASDPSRYILLRPHGDRFVAVDSPFSSASFDVDLLRLRLRVRAGLQPTSGWILIVPGTAPNALTDLAGNPLDGNRDGLPGSDAVLTLRS